MPRLRCVYRDIGGPGLWGWGGWGAEPCSTSEYPSGRGFIGNAVMAMLPPSLTDVYQRDLGPTSLDMQNACNQGLGVLCMQARDQRIRARVETAFKHYDW